jgi:hypothetical protein
MTDYQEDSSALIPSDIDEEPLSMSLSSMGGDGDEEGFVTVPEESGGGLLSHTTLLVVVVAVVATASLYLMRATQGDLSASAELEEIEAKIQTTLTRLNSPNLLQEGDPLLAENLNALLTPTEDMTAIFEHDVRDQQVPIEDVKKDPFSLALGDDSLAAANITGTGDDLGRKLEKYRTELRGYALQSIMAGSRNIAVIGGEFYKQGDTLGSFRITAIDKFAVYLEAAGAPFELTLRDGGN